MALNSLPCKQFDEVARELRKRKMEMVSHGRNHVYTRIKKVRRGIGTRKEREDRGLIIYFEETIRWNIVSMGSVYYDIACIETTSSVLGWDCPNVITCRPKRNLSIILYSVT